MRLTEAIRPAVKALAVLIVAAALLVAGRAALVWQGVGIVPALVTGWWAFIVSASFVGSVVAAFILLGDSGKWAQSTYPWRNIALEVAGLAACLAYSGSVIVAVIGWRWWPR